MNANSDKDYIDVKMESFEARLDARFAAIDVRFSAIDVRLAAIDARFVAMEAKLAELRASIVAEIAKSMAEVNTRLAEMSDRITDLTKWWAATFITTIALLITGMAMMWNVALPRGQLAQVQQPAPIIIQLPPWPVAPMPAAQIAAPAPPATVRK
ncbi:hypothetical protein [Rugamonas sp.]|uniref:hypothetical protein n=1 Tax=Rugamonas sp. TaxID=1926287 RepID=UPI0025E8B123|nr:hypothetical protein [Rugamonas sp.]